MRSWILSDQMDVEAELKTLHRVKGHLLEGNRWDHLETKGLEDGETTSALREGWGGGRQTELFI